MVYIIIYLKLSIGDVTMILFCQYYVITWIQDYAN